MAAAGGAAALSAGGKASALSAACDLATPRGAGGAGAGAGGGAAISLTGGGGGSRRGAVSRFFSAAGGALGGAGAALAASAVGVAGAVALIASSVTGRPSGLASGTGCPYHIKVMKLATNTLANAPPQALGDVDCHQRRVHRLAPGNIFLAAGHDNRHAEGVATGRLFGGRWRFRWTRRSRSSTARVCGCSMPPTITGRCGRAGGRQYTTRRSSTRRCRGL